jgi:hypothetical protein
MVKNIGIYSIPFGYGPTGKALTIASFLDNAIKVNLFTYGAALSLAQNSNYNVENCLSRNVCDWDTDALLQNAIFIVIMDFTVAKQLISKYPNLRVIFFDSLLWWRKSIENIPVCSCTYIAQDFPGTQEAANRMFSKNWKPYITGPIVKAYNKSIKSQQRIMLINYGGIESPHIKLGCNTNFHILMTKCLIETLKYFSFNIVFAGNASAIYNLKSIFRNHLHNIRFLALSHENFVYHLSLTKLLITTPGIETTYESFSMDVPTIFLPPLNSTQNQQLNEFAKSGFWDPRASLGYERSMVEKDFVDYRLETVNLLNIFESLINNLSKRKQFQSGLHDQIHKLENKDCRETQILLQKNFLARLQKTDVDLFRNIVLGHQ